MAYQIMKKYIFTADLHGNIVQYNKLFDFAKQEKIDMIIMGGDLTPKNAERRSVIGQRDFIINELFPLMTEFKKTNPTEIALIMGNDDYKANHQILKDNQKTVGYHLIDETPLEYAGFYFGGYTYVPYTPFQWKDWEKRDLATETDTSFRGDTREEGFISQGDDNKIPFNIYQTMMDSAIDTDLSMQFGTINPDKLVLISHAPPYDTVCDYTAIKDGTSVKYKHVGSRGILSFIKKYQPKLTLHGHIHDAAELSGNFYEKIGKSTVANVSNDHLTETLKIIKFTLDTLEIERITL